jgi:hypothetical protein
VAAGQAPERHVQTLLVDNAVSNIASQLDAAGQPFLVLKGAVIAQWLYDDPSERTYSDLDILVPPKSEADVVALLRDLGYEPLLDPATLRVISPEEQPLRNHLGVVVDLHVTLKGVGLPPARAWAILSEGTEAFDWLGTAVRTLGEPARAMHLALHVAQSGTVDSKAIQDLKLGLDRLSLTTWRRAAEIADRVDATEAFSAGLFLLPEGIHLARRLGIRAPTDSAVLMDSDDSVYRPAAALERLLATKNRRKRLVTGWAYLFPSGTWLRHADPRAAEGGLSFAVARIRRPFVTLGRAAVAYRERRRFLRGKRSA